jgi:hypothetical protein
VNLVTTFLALLSTAATSPVIQTQSTSSSTNSDTGKTTTTLVNPKKQALSVTDDPQQCN